MPYDFMLGSHYKQRNIRVKYRVRKKVIILIKSDCVYAVHKYNKLQLTFTHMLYLGGRYEEKSHILWYLHHTKNLQTAEKTNPGSLTSNNINSNIYCCIGPYL